MFQNVRTLLQERVSTPQIARFGLSVLIAIVLWGWVTQLQDPVETQRFAEMPITAPELAGTVEIITSLPRATVTLTDVASRLDEIARSDIVLTLDTSSIDGPGTFQLPVIVQMDERLREVRVSPDTVSVEVEEEVSQNFPLTVENQMLADDARRIVDTNPNISEVTVTGTASAVNRIDRVVLPVSIQGRNRDFVEMIQPYAVDEDNQRVQEVEIIPSHVRTEIDVEARGKTVSIVPQVSGAPAPGYVIQQQIAVPSSIIVDGPEDVLSSLLFVNTEPVNIDGATESLSELVALEGLPEGVELIEPEVGRVEVRVSIGTSGGTANTIPDMPVTVANGNEGLEYSLDPATVNINVSAPSDVLASLTPEDVTVEVDASGLGPGVYTLQPTIDVPDDVNVIQLEPNRVVMLVSSDSATPAPSSSGDVFLTGAED